MQYFRKSTSYKNLVKAFKARNKIIADSILFFIIINFQRKYDFAFQRSHM